jgi:hypothetical protein
MLQRGRASRPGQRTGHDAMAFPFTQSDNRSSITRGFEKLGVNSYTVKPVEFASFADVMKTIKVYWLLTNESPFQGSGSW